MSRRCLKCTRLTGADHRRGLCRRCYRDPEVREMYTTLPRGLWATAGFVCRTGHDKIKLIDLFGQGLSDKAIAAATGRSVAAVTKERQRLGLRVPVERQAAHRRIEGKL